MRSPLVLVVLLLTAAALLAPAASATVYLKADFDDKLVGLHIGMGGAALGEPVSRIGVADTVRGGAMPTPCLDIMDNSTTSAGNLRFEFLESQEVTAGGLVISMNLWFPAYEQFFIYIREQGTSARSFLNLRFAESGAVSCSDANGDNGVIGSYETGRHYRVWIFFAMDTGLYSVYLDGAPAIISEDHGVTDRGVGAVLLGCSYDTDRDGRFYVDDLSVTDYYPSVHHLRANFNYKPIDMPVGVGGPEVGEPVFVSPIVITAMIRDEPTYTPSLEICDIDEYAAGHALFGFLYDAEVLSGVLVIAAELRFGVVDEYWFSVREHGGAAEEFTDLFFSSSALIGLVDGSGHVEWLCPYVSGRSIPIMIIHNLDAGTFDVWIDGLLRADDRAHGIVGRGIGSVIIGTGNDPNLQGCVYVDNVWAATLTPPALAVCCMETECGLMIPMDCAYNTGEFHADLHGCLPNPCNPALAGDWDPGERGRSLQVSPSPASGAALVTYRVGGPASVRLEIFDVAGRRVRALFDGRSESPTGQIRWDGRDDAGRKVGSGVYLVRLKSNGFTEADRLVIVE
ncbi:MAG: T9SS type A sorting domain-containing protein [Candidatus Eisenbacteria bacterium]|nr:T9SS type A sorting domain-containing protein [Candidatus Eisenbacteria bacterium]